MWKDVPIALLCIWSSILSSKQIQAKYFPRKSVPYNKALKWFPVANLKCCQIHIKNCQDMMHYMLLILTCALWDSFSVFCNKPGWSCCSLALPPRLCTHCSLSLCKPAVATSIEHAPGYSSLLSCSFLPLFYLGSPHNYSHTCGHIRSGTWHPTHPSTSMLTKPLYTMGAGYWMLIGEGVTSLKFCAHTDNRHRLERPKQAVICRTSSGSPHHAFAQK